MDFDTAVKLNIYETISRTTQAPTSADVAKALITSPEEVEAAFIEAADGYSGEPMMLEVRNGRPVPQPCVIHFAVPAARWWDDIIYT